MTRIAEFMAGAASGIIAAALILSQPAQAGTCSPVTVKGRAADPAATTTQAQIKLTQQAARIGGKVKQNSTDCKPVSGGFQCKTSAAVCP
jgi:hypothetical protein